VNNVRPGNSVQLRNLTPNPFPRGKGNNRAFGSSSFGRTIRIPFLRGKDLNQSGSPSHYGKGLGVRFSGATLLLISMMAMTAASCAQVHEKMFTLDCAVGRAPLAGELAPGTAMALDVSTSPIPLLFPAHRAIARCDDAGVVTMNIETPVDTGLSQLSTPLSTAASHVTYMP
jgi:hypothetical protein